MTATEELRRMLDERGVEYGFVHGYKIFHWDYDGANGKGSVSATEVDGGINIMACNLTPEQAIAATLGATDARPTQAESSGTCKLDDFADVPFSVDYEIEGYDMDSGRDYATLAECSACGAYIIVPPEYHHVLTCDGDEVYQPYRFCPNCGRRIEVDS